MDLLTDRQRELYALVGRCLREVYGDHAEPTARQATFVVPCGSYGIRLTASAVGEAEGVVELYTWVACQLELTLDVARYLLEKNASLRFGSLGIDRDGGVLLATALFPDQLHAVSIARLVELLGVTAREVELELVERF